MIITDILSGLIRGNKIKFRVQPGSCDAIIDKVNVEAQSFHEQPFGKNVFPSGTGKRAETFVTVSNPTVLISAMYVDPKGTVVRLWNSTPSTKSVTGSFETYGQKIVAQMEPYRFCTYLIKAGMVVEVDPVMLENK